MSKKKQAKELRKKLRELQYLGEQSTVYNSNFDIEILELSDQLGNIEQPFIDSNIKINQIILDETGIYTEKQKIDQIDYYIKSNPDVDLGVGGIMMPGNSHLFNTSEHKQYPIINAIDSCQLEIVDYLLSLDNAVSEQMIDCTYVMQKEVMSDCDITTQKVAVVGNPFYHLLRKGIYNKKIISIFNKMLNLFKDSALKCKTINLKDIIDSAIEIAILEQDIVEFIKFLAEQDYVFSAGTYINAYNQKNSKIIEIITKSDETILDRAFLEASSRRDYNVIQVFLNEDENIINTRNEKGKNALDLLVQSNINFPLNPQGINMYELLRGKGLEHGRATEKFFTSYYNQIKFDYEKSPFEIIKNLIKMNPDLIEKFDITKIQLAEKGEIDAALEHDFWMMLKKNQPEFKYFEKKYDGSVFDVITNIGELNKYQPMKINNELFDEFGSLVNLVLLKMFEHGIPSKELYIAVKNGLASEYVINITNNYMENHALEVNEYSRELMQDTKTAGEQSSIECID